MEHQEAESLEQVAQRITARAKARMQQLLEGTIISVRMVAFKGCVHCIITADVDQQEEPQQGGEDHAAPAAAAGPSCPSPLSAISSEKDELMQRCMSEDIAAEFGDGASVSVYHVGADLVGALGEEELGALLAASSLAAAAALHSRPAPGLPRLLPCYLDPLVMEQAAQGAQEQAPALLQLVVPGISAAAGTAQRHHLPQQQPGGAPPMMFSVVAQQGGRVLARCAVDLARVQHDTVALALPPGLLQPGLLQLFLVSSASCSVLASSCALVMPSASTCQEIKALYSTMMQEAAASLAPATATTATAAQGPPWDIQCFVHAKHYTPFAMDLARVMEVAQAASLPGVVHLVAPRASSWPAHPLQAAAHSLLLFCINLELWDTAELVRGCSAALGLPPAGAHEDDVLLASGTAGQQLGEASSREGAAAGELHPLLIPLLVQLSGWLLVQLSAAMQLSALRAMADAASAAQHTTAEPAQEQAPEAVPAATPALPASLRRRIAMAKHSAAGSTSSSQQQAAAEADLAGSSSLPRASPSAKACAALAPLLKAHALPDLALARLADGRCDTSVHWHTMWRGFHSQPLELAYQHWRLAHGMPCDMATLAIALSYSSLVLHSRGSARSLVSSTMQAMAALELALVALYLALLACRRCLWSYVFLRQRALAAAVTAMTFLLLLAPPGSGSPWSTSLAALWKVMFVQRYLLLPYCFQVS